METTWQDVLAFDQLAWVLSACIVLSYVVASIWNEENCSLVHPLILAHQAKFSPTRKQGETPTITSSGATTHLLPTTPDRSVKSLLHLLLKAEGRLQQIDINSIVTQNIAFNTLVANVRNNLWSHLASTKTEDGNEDHPRLLILCADPYLRLVLSLAAATLPIVTILATPKRSGTLPVEIQLALEPHIAHLCLVVSELPADMTKEVLGLKLATRCQIMPSHHLSAWFQSGNTETVAPDDLSELSKARLRIVSYSSRPDGQQTNKARVFEFTPENLLAGVTGSLGLFPLAGKLNAKDTIALELAGEEIWGSASSMAVAGLYSGASVYFFNGFKLLSECKPTVLLLKSMTAQILAEEVVQLSKLSLLKKLAIGRRLSKVFNGALGSPLPETTEWVGPHLRAMLTDDPITQSTATLIRAGFGVSLQRVYVHPVGAGPLLASQQYDFQLARPHRLTTSTMVHCGPPGANVECKIVAVPEPALINHDAWKGKLLVRGPSVGSELTPDGDAAEAEDFHAVADVAQVLPNGTFQVFSRSLSGDD